MGENKKRKGKAETNPESKTQKLNTNNSLCYVQILGTGLDTQDTSPSILLFFDSQRFIFNAGEGFQRFCTEHKIKLSKINHVLLTRICSETAGGLAGVLLTLAGVPKKGIGGGGEKAKGMSVNFRGPPGLQYFVDALRCTVSKSTEVAHTKNNFRVDCLGSDRAAALLDGEKPVTPIDPDQVVNISAVLLRPNDSAAMSNHPPAGCEDISVIYVCELPEVKGKFDLEKAKALGLKPISKYRELQLGRSVTVSDDDPRIVYPSDVMGASVAGPIVLIVDCPTLSHLKFLLSLGSLSSYYDDGGKVVTCAIHLSPSSVTQTDEYQTWMRRFGGAQHIMAGREKMSMEIPILRTSAKMAARLNYLCPNLFPSCELWAHHNQNLYNAESDNLASNVFPVSNLSQSVDAENLLKFRLRPHSQFGLDKSEIPGVLGHAEVIDELILENPDIVDAAVDVRNLWNMTQSNLPSCLENISRNDMEIVFLGTGSSQPSKYRNVSSIFINLFSKGSLLLDCGEGTLGQLRRRFGVIGANDFVRGLKFIWISHKHADHYLGIASILSLRCRLLKGTNHDRIIVIAPEELKTYLDKYQLVEDLDMQFLDCGDTTDAKWKGFESNCERPAGEETMVFKNQQKLKQVLTEAGLQAIISVPVIHCRNAFGIVLQAVERLSTEGKTIPGWKLVYSGDTVPCQNLKDASKRATVLIHEATFEDSMVKDAIEKKHSRTTEAIEVGGDGPDGAYRIILTHFSQRYPKIPVFSETHMNKTCISFDLMSVNTADLPVLPKFFPISNSYSKMKRWLKN
ncbi:hypothetical protein MKW92_010446 [Papaver armeniacum]|nr:hypothetical protein MKW92_010446 [Papaver armeniacum]